MRRRSLSFVASFKIVAIGNGLLLFVILLSSASLVARAQNQQPASSRQLQHTAPVNAWPGKAKRWALVIGVDQYLDPQISPLKGAANDAKMLADALARYAGFPQDQVILLSTDQPVERQPTRVNILRRLSNLASAVPKDGLLLVSFAGHGMERGDQAYLLPSDAQISNDISFLEDTALSVARMNERIRATGVGQVVVLLDACRNDPGGRADASNPLTQAYVRGFNFDVRNREVQAYATIYATAVGQRAYEYTEKKQGYFTWAIVEGLKGGAANDKGEVTLANLVKYVQEIVPKRIMVDLGAGKQQRPFARIEGYRADELVVAIGGRASSPAGSASTLDVPSAPPAVDSSAIELSYWETIKNSADPEDFKSYLEKYPKGQFVDLARRRAGKALAPAAEKHNKSGKELFDQKKYAEADAEYRLALFLNPDKSEYHYNLAKVLKEEGKSEEADAEQKEGARLREPELREYLKTRLDWPSAHSSLASFLQDQKRYAEAEAEYREAIRLDIQKGYDPDELDALVECLKQEKKFAEAEAEFKSVIQRNPNKERIHWKFGSFLESQNRLAEAEAEYREAERLDPGSNMYALSDVLVKEKKFKEADAAWRELLRLKPDSAKYHYPQFGRYLADQKRWAEAEAAFREAIRLDPAGNWAGAWHDSLAKALEEQKKFTEAEAEYREVARQSDSYFSGKGELVAFYVRQKDYAKAEGVFKDWILGKPNNSEAHYQFAMYLRDRQRWAEAEAEFREALRLKPDDDYSQTGLAYVLGQQKKWADAEAIYKERIKAAPKDASKHKELADALADEKKWKEAEAEYREAIRLDPNGPYNYMSLGFFFMKQKKWAEAEAAFRESVRLKPDDADYHSYVADSLAEQQKRAEAEAEYRTAIQLNPGRQYIHQSFGKFWGKQDKWVEAEKEFREAVRLSPDDGRFHADLALALQKQNKAAEAGTELKAAEAIYRKGLLEHPEYAYLHHYLGLCLELENKLPEAEAELKEAVRLTPGDADYQSDLQRVLKAQKKEQ